jgi:3',5'-cyclic-AMP phosphodiesterase
MRFSSEVFAVEDTCAQLTWRGAPAGPVAITVSDGRTTRTLETISESGPGSFVIDELEADTSYTITAGPKASDPGRPQPIRTLARLPGPELTRIATISDIHIGERWFGLLPRTFERPEPPVPHTLRCAAAAIDEWTRWGARRVLFKGDLVDHGSRPEWNALASLLTTVPQPWSVMLGNHETMNRHRERAEVMLAELGLPAAPVRTIDEPGVRIVLVETAVDDRGYGRVRDVASAVDAVGETTLPCFVVLHHHIQRLPVPTFWPPGISSISGNRFVRQLRRANPAIIVTSGHSHRHRKRLIDGVPHIEVGSVKDYPGVWAGYAVHERGVRQLVRRVSPNDCLRWTDKTRHVMFGAWQAFAPGTLADRCFVHQWSR